MKKKKGDFEDEEYDAYGDENKKDVKKDSAVEISILKSDVLTLKTSVTKLRTETESM